MSSLLNRAILSHLLVAVPPAAILGMMVAKINESALRYEAQLVHLSTANRMKEALEDRVRDAVAQLDHSERVLSINALPFSERQDVLRALVASGNMPYLLVFRPDGKFDASVHTDAQEVLRTSMSPSMGTRAQQGGFSLSPPDEQGRVLIVIPWENEQGLVGYLGTTILPADLQDVATELTSTYLGPGGRVQVIDGRGRQLIGDKKDGLHPDVQGTPFEGLTLSGDTDGLTSLSAGISKQFIDATGEARLGSVVSDPDLGWLVGTSRPVKTAFESIAKVHQRVLLMSLAAALLAGLVGLLLARQISQPIQALISAVRRAARANFDPERRVAAKGELGQLAGAFNTAVDELARHRMDLKQTTQLRLRMSRLVSSAAMHEVLAASDEQTEAGEVQAVCVLYADVVLPPGQTVDTEHLVTVLSEFFGAAHETMRKHGGLVDRFSGDAVIGIFSGPNPKAALAAAADLVQDAEAVSERWSQYLGGPLSASAAVVTGEGRIRRASDSGEQSVSGPLVELAGSGQAKAAAGQILMDEATRDQGGAQGQAVAKRDAAEPTWFLLAP